MTRIEISSDEHRSGYISAAKLEAAVQAIERDGFVLLEDCVEVEHLDALNAQMVVDVQKLIAREDAPFNWHSGNIQQDPPPFAPFLYRDILLNDLVIAVTSAVLGPGVKNVMYGGNTAMPGDQRQPVHADMGHLWPRQDVAHPPVQLVVNMPTVDVSPDNGSTEIWPGTHKDLTVTPGKDIKIPADRLEAQRQERPPFQPSFRRGAALIRDIRLWHAGMPNRTATPRPMIAMIHVPWWFDAGDPLLFPEDTREFFEHPKLRTCARYTSDPIDYIHATHAHEYVKPKNG